MYKVVGAAAICAVLATGSADAATVSVTTNENDPHVTQFGIRADTGTVGKDLGGMIVKAKFADGGTETLVWAPTFGQFGGVSGSGFSMLYGYQNFELSVGRAMTSLTMLAAPGNAMFDIETPRAIGDTYGTKVGFSFRLPTTDTHVGTFGVTYTGAVTLQGHPRGIDTFTTMIVDFTGLKGGSLSDALSFSTDLDSLEVAGDLVPSNVPLPASLPLLVAGLGAMELTRRHKRQA
jgi:hypothetical protein